MTEQLDLFGRTIVNDTGAMILAFPPGQLHSLLRHQVEIMLKQEKADQLLRYYNGSIERLGKKYFAHGLNAEETTKIATDYGNALRRMYWAERERRGIKLPSEEDITGEASG